MIYVHLLIQGWLSGREAEFVEMLTEEEVGKKCVEAIKSFLNKKELPILKRVIR